jgi:hypothetical protein
VLEGIQDVEISETEKEMETLYHRGVREEEEEDEDQD